MLKLPAGRPDHGYDPRPEWFSQIVPPLYHEG